MERIEEILDGVKTMGIGGHVRPDGDCVGSCMALYLYIKKWYPMAIWCQVPGHEAAYG